MIKDEFTIEELLEILKPLALPKIKRKDIQMVFYTIDEIEQALNDYKL